MITPIGRLLKSNGYLFWLLMMVSAIIVSLDLALVATGQCTTEREHALAAVIVVFFGAVALFNRDGDSFGLRLSPIQGWGYWAKRALLLGVVMLAIILAVSGVVLGILRYQIPPQYYCLSHESQIWPLFVFMCLDAPISEEIIFRLAICPVITARWGTTTAIIVSGVLFSAVHVLNGNPAPDNLIAGFILAWAFLKSGTIAVPIALHSLGNLFTFLYQVAFFYYHT